MILRLTNAASGEERRHVMLNTAFIVAVYDIFDGETRIRTSDGNEYIVSETVDEIGRLWRQS